LNKGVSDVATTLHAVFGASTSSMSLYDVVNDVSNATILASLLLSLWLTSNANLDVSVSCLSSNLVWYQLGDGLGVSGVRFNDLLSILGHSSLGDFSLFSQPLDSSESLLLGSSDGNKSSSGSSLSHESSLSEK